MFAKIVARTLVGLGLLIGFLGILFNVDTVLLAFVFLLFGATMYTDRFNSPSEDAKVISRYLWKVEENVDLGHKLWVRIRNNNDILWCYEFNVYFHPEADKFRSLKVGDVVDFSYYPRKIQDDLKEEVSSYLGILRVHRAS